VKVFQLKYSEKTQTIKKNKNKKSVALQALTNLGRQDGILLSEQYNSTLPFIIDYIPSDNAVIVLVIIYNNPWRYSSDERRPAEQPPLAVFPDCTRRYWVDMWSAHRIPQLHFQLSKPDRYFFIQVTTQFIRSRG
jgi:hypothetical protein